MIYNIHPDSPDIKRILHVVEILKNGGIIIYPTDSVYGLGCDINNPKAIDKVAKIKGIKLQKAHFSFICNDLSQLSEYAQPISNEVFKLLKKNLPGPFTFILNANNMVPKIFKSKKKTIGIRIPDNNILLEIVKYLGRPVMTTSIRDDDEIIEYSTDPELIHDKYKNKVDIVINGGFGNNEASTVLDCTLGKPEIIRQGPVQLKL